MTSLPAAATPTSGPLSMVVASRPATSTGRTARAPSCAARPETWPSRCAAVPSLPGGSRASHFGAHNPEETTMNTISSQDGTTISYEKQGEGPALILVDGALSVYSSGGKSELAKLLAPHLTVYGYDRRGRGGSGDTLPYAVDREIEDIEALIDDAGGSAYLYGHSSGASLAMLAAVKLRGKVSKIAMYEAPYNDEPEAQESWRQYLGQLREVLADCQPGDAVALFMRYVGTPADQVD